MSPVGPLIEYDTIECVVRSQLGLVALCASLLAPGCLGRDSDQPAPDTVSDEPSSALADVRARGGQLLNLASAPLARQVAQMRAVASALRRDDRVLGVDRTGGALAYVAEDLVIESRRPLRLPRLLRNRGRELLRFARQPKPFYARGISGLTQFPTSAGRYDWANQWNGVVAGCGLTVAAGHLSGSREFRPMGDRPSQGVIGVDSFTGCTPGSGRPLKGPRGQGRIILAPRGSGRLRVVADGGTFLLLQGAGGREFRLSLRSGLVVPTG